MIGRSNAIPRRTRAMRECWRVEMPAGANPRVSVGEAGNIYVTYSAGSIKRAKKLSPDGDELWDVQLFSGGSPFVAPAALDGSMHYLTSAKAWVKIDPETGRSTFGRAIPTSSFNTLLCVLGADDVLYKSNAYIVRQHYEAGVSVPHPSASLSGCSMTSWAFSGSVMYAGTDTTGSAIAIDLNTGRQLWRRDSLRYGYANANAVAIDGVNKLVRPYFGEYDALIEFGGNLLKQKNKLSCDSLFGLFICNGPDGYIYRGIQKLDGGWRLRKESGYGAVFWEADIPDLTGNGYGISAAVDGDGALVYVVGNVIIKARR